MPKLQIIGCSSGMPEAEVANSSYLVSFKNKLYLFDCGEGTSSALLRNKINYKRIENVFISHGHPDHVIGLPVLIQMNHLAGRTSPLDIYLPQELVKPLNKMLLATYLIPDKLSFEWRLHALKPNPVFREGDFAVNAFPNSHLRGNESIIKSLNLYNKMQSYCFTIATAKTKMVYSGDLSSAKDLDDLLDNADLLLTEGFHVDLKRIFNLVKLYDVENLILTHLPSSYQKKRKSITKMSKNTGVNNLHFAEEGQIYKY